MASRREVDLVIKAKDQTTQVADAITKALENLGKSLGNMSKGGKKADDVLGGLAEAVSGLDKVLKSASGADRLATELGRAEKAATSLNSKIGQTEKELTELQARQKEAAASATKLAAEQGKLEKALAKETATLAKSQKAQKERTAALASAEKALRSAAGEQDRLTAAIAKQEGKVAEVTAKLAAYQTVLDSATKPTKQMSADIARTVKSLETQNAKLAEMKVNLNGAQQAVTETTADISRLAAEIEQNAAKITKQNQAVSGTKSALAGLKTQVKAVATEEKALATALVSTEQALQNQQEEAKQTAVAMEGLVAANAQAGASMDKLAAAAGKGLQLAFAAQRREMLETKREWINSQAAVKTLADEMARVEQPTLEMTQAFEKAKVEAKQNKTEYDILRTGLHQLSGTLKTTATDLNGLRAQQEAFANVQGQTAAKLNLSRQAAAESAAANAKLSAEARKAAAANREVQSSTSGITSVTNSAAAATNKWAAAYRALYGESRTAMSWTQRLRGEVISLVAAYGGIFGVIGMLGRVVEATQKVEAAQSRLNALYGGDQNKAGAEFDFIRRQADRLGIDIGELGDQYTKFAAATKGTNLAGEETRRIFLRVAEAGVVNRLSMEDMSGIFRALVQIASKGKVQLEELQGQLGDRLPGALKIMADGLGITVAQLQEMTKEGSVSSDALSNFANNLEERYGDALPEALKSTAVVLGQFRNAVTQALLSFGQGGFIEGFNSLLKDLTETMRSADFKAFAANVSSAFGLLAKVLGVAAANFKLVTAAILTFIGIRLVPVVSAMVGVVTQYAAAVNAAAIQQRVMTRETVALNGAMAASQASTGRMSALLGGLRGGLAGLGIAAAAVLLTEWAASADDVNEAMTEHEALMGKVKAAYDATKTSVEGWRKELALVKADTLLANIEATKGAVETLRGEMNSPFELFDSNMYPELGKIAQGVVKLNNEFLDGQKTQKEYKDSMTALALEAEKLGINGNVIRDIIAGQVEQSEATNKVVKAVQDAKDAYTVVTGTAEEAEAAMKRLNGTTEENEEAFKGATTSADKYKTALDGIKAFIPGLAAELERLKEMAKLDELVADLMKMGPLTKQQMDLINQARSAINSKATAVDGSYVDKVIGTESGGNATAKNPYSTATGLGQFISSTWLGMFKKYFPDRAAGMTDAMILALREDADVSRKMIELLAEENGAALQKAGLEVSDATRYLAHFLGSDAAIKTLKADPNTAMSSIVSPQVIDANKSVLEGKTAGDVIAWAQRKMGISKTQLEVEKHITEEQQKQNEKAKEITTNRENDLRLAEVEAKYKDADLVKRTQEIEIEKERQKLAEIGKTLDKEGEEAIRRRVELQLREKSNQEAINASKKTAEDTEARFTALIQQREALLKQAEALRAQGNTTGADQATQQAKGLQSAIDAAAQAAIAMWQKIGGPEADAAIAKINAAAAASKNLASSGNAATAMWQQTGQIIGDNLVNAFDEFAQAVANGENAWKALGRAITKAAAQILIDIGKMIIKQAIFNALSGVFGLQPGANGLFHSGTGSGTFGSNLPNRTKNVSPMAWANAPRFHKGYQPGLSNNEMAAIVEKDEAIMTEDSAFHPKNQAATLGAAMAAGGGGKVNVKVVNAIDSGDFVAEGVNTSRGEQSIMNMMRKNKASLKEILS